MMAVILQEQGTICTQRAVCLARWISGQANKIKYMQIKSRCSSSFFLELTWAQWALKLIAHCRPPSCLGPLVVVVKDFVVYCSHSVVPFSYL